MFSLAVITFGLAMVVILAFWLLFFFVVQVRIADRKLSVQETSRFGFLVTRWPHEEMQAYLASLEPDEDRRPINIFLRHANLLVRTLMGVYLFLLIALMVTGRDL